MNGSDSVAAVVNDASEPRLAFNVYEHSRCKTKINSSDIDKNTENQFISSQKLTFWSLELDSDHRTFVTRLPHEWEVGRRKALQNKQKTHINETFHRILNREKLKGKCRWQKNILILLRSCIQAVLQILFENCQFVKKLKTAEVCSMIKRPMMSTQLHRSTTRSQLFNSLPGVL